MNHLDSRTRLPDDLRALLERYPRETWSGHENLGQTARFWLNRHDMFRDLGASLAAGLADHREGRIDQDGFRAWFAPRLNFFLGHLDGHHQVEDQHYFPVFQAADAGLAHGFALLEADHDVIHADLLATAEAANRFLAATAEGPSGGAGLWAAEAYGAASETLLRRLMRHLADEEDLVIPLILDRGEPGLGI